MQSTHISLLARAKEEMGGATWQEFFDLYSSMIDAWLRRRGLQAQDVEDVRQEVMTVVIRELPNFEHNGRTGAFRNWLRTATANRLRQFWRERSRRKDGADHAYLAEMADQLEDAHSQLSQVWQKEHDAFVLTRLLVQVESDFRPSTVEAFRKVALGGQDAEKVAAELQMSVNAIRIAQSRVLRSLRQVAAGLVD